MPAGTPTGIRSNRPEMDQPSAASRFERRDTLRAAGAIGRARLGRLVEAVKAVLLAAIEAGGSTLRDYARPDGELGYFSKQWRVYGRDGEPCRCGRPVRRRTDSGRSTFFCPACQR